MMTITTSVLYSWWNLASCIGMRRLGAFLKWSNPSAYGDTIFHFGGGKGNSVNDGDSNGEMKGLVALTIDDGLCRQDEKINGCSMVTEMRQLLKRYDAHATFFLCTDYTTSKDAQSLLQDGHEIGNHLQKDVLGYYHKLSKEDFRNELVKTNAILTQMSSSNDDDDDNDNDNDNNNRSGAAKIKWFRAPQGRMNQQMAEVVKEEGMTHVLGDCYCDDWAFAEARDTAAGAGSGKGKGNGADKKAERNKSKGNHNNKSPVAKIMLKQVQPDNGSILGLHMPQRGFRESCLDSLQEILEGLKQRNIRCVCLTELEQAAKPASD